MPIDYKTYPANWFTELRPAVLARAGNCCEGCGLQNGQLVWSVKRGEATVWFAGYPEMISSGQIKQVKVVLTVAHLDHDEGNPEVRLDRLKALCQLCHLLYDVAEKKRRRNVKKKQINLDL